MSQRTVAHICIWVMILAGILFLMSISVVPYFAALLNEMSDGQTRLPIIVQFILNLSTFTVQYGWFFTPLYLLLFVGAIAWYRTTKPQQKVT